MSLRLEEPHPFALETASTHYAADRTARARHLKLKVDLDFKARSISGTASHTLEAVRALQRVSFDAVELAVTAARVDGRTAQFDASGRRVHVTLPKRVKAGALFTIELDYSGTPRKGLYFIGPDANDATRPVQAWTQGQDEDSRYWFPCLDAPSQKCTTEVLATFPKEMTALSNGALQSDTAKGKRRTMHYRLDRPHSPYLVTLVVGQFEDFTQEAGGVTIRTLFPRGRKADAVRCVKRTPEMMALFERFSGQAYPWGDYAQVFVGEFIFGGMENTSATTLTDTVLADERASLDYSAEFLIAHELAHQWFGDLLTCREWPHGWLNEGFATYSEVLWKEQGDGEDEADHERAGQLEKYLDEVAERYARPIVARRFDAPIDLFDAHLYEKGSLVLHELRTRLGDEEFFAVVHHYVATHQDGAVETVDLSRAVEAATGKNFDRFFDEYVLRAGHPQLEVELEYEAERKSMRLLVKQTQEGDAVHLTLPVAVEVKGRHTRHALEVTGKEHVFHLPAAREPTVVEVDGRRGLLATLKERKAPGLWRAQLVFGASARARTTAAKELGKDGSAESIAALGKGLLDNTSFWATRAACAKALAAARTPEAKAALLKGLKVTHPKARRAVVSSLGAFRGEADVEAALLALCKAGDRSVFVEADAARALGKLRAKGARPVLESMLKRPAFQDAVASGALDGLAALQDPAAWKAVVAAIEPGQPPLARRTALAAAAKLAEVSEKKTEAIDVLTQRLRDANFRVRLAAIDAAATLGDQRMIGPLSSTPFLDGREDRLAREAVRTLRAKSPPRELTQLRTDFDALKAEVKALKEKLDAPRKKRR